MSKLRNQCGFEPRAGDHYMYQDEDTEFYVSIHGINATNNHPDVTSITIKKPGWERGVGYAVAPNGHLHLGRNSRGFYANLNPDHRDVVDRLRNETQALFVANRG